MPPPTPLFPPAFRLNRHGGAVLDRPGEGQIARGLCAMEVVHLIDGGEDGALSMAPRSACPELTTVAIALNGMTKGARDGLLPLTSRLAGSYDPNARQARRRALADMAQRAANVAGIVRASNLSKAAHTCAKAASEAVETEPFESLVPARQMADALRCARAMAPAFVVAEALNGFNKALALGAQGDTPDTETCARVNAALQADPNVAKAAQDGGAAQ